MRREERAPDVASEEDGIAVEGDGAERGARGPFDLVFALVASIVLWGVILLGAWALLF